MRSALIQFGKEVVKEGLRVDEQLRVLKDG